MTDELPRTAGPLNPILYHPTIADNPPQCEHVGWTTKTKTTTRMLNTPTHYLSGRRYWTHTDDRLLVQRPNRAVLARVDVLRRGQAANRGPSLQDSPQLGQALSYPQLDAYQGRIQAVQHVRYQQPEGGSRIGTDTACRTKPKINSWEPNALPR